MITPDEKKYTSKRLEKTHKNVETLQHIKLFKFDDQKEPAKDTHHTRNLSSSRSDDFDFTSPLNPHELKKIREDSLEYEIPSARNLSGYITEASELKETQENHLLKEYEPEIVEVFEIGRKPVSKETKQSNTSSYSKRTEIMKRLNNVCQNRGATTKNNSSVSSKKRNPTKEILNKTPNNESKLLELYNMSRKSPLRRKMTVLEAISSEDPSKTPAHLAGQSQPNPRSLAISCNSSNISTGHSTSPTKKALKMKFHSPPMMTRTFNDDYSFNRQLAASNRSPLKLNSPGSKFAEEYGGIPSLQLGSMGHPADNKILAGEDPLNRTRPSQSKNLHSPKPQASFVKIKEPTRVSCLMETLSRSLAGIRGTSADRKEFSQRNGLAESSDTISVAKSLSKAADNGLISKHSKMKKLVGEAPRLNSPKSSLVWEKKGLQSVIGKPSSQAAKQTLSGQEGVSTKSLLNQPLGQKKPSIGLKLLAKNRDSKSQKTSQKGSFQKEGTLESSIGKGCKTEVSHNNSQACRSDSAEKGNSLFSSKLMALSQKLKINLKDRKGASSKQKIMKGLSGINLKCQLAREDFSGVSGFGGSTLENFEDPESGLYESVEHQIAAKLELYGSKSRHKHHENQWKDSETKKSSKYSIQKLTKNGGISPYNTTDGSGQRKTPVKKNLFSVQASHSSTQEET